MNTPPSRLLNAASAISIPRPGTPLMASMAPRMSMCEVDSPSAGTGLGSGILIVVRWANEATVRPSAR